MTHPTHRRFPLVIALVALLVGSALAQEEEGQPGGEVVPLEEVSSSSSDTPLEPLEIDPCGAAANEEEGALVLPSLLEGLNFGVGVGLTRLGRPDIRGTAIDTVPDGSGGTQNVVRVTNQQQYLRELWFETHYLFNPFCLLGKPAATGPFLGLRAFGDDGGVLDALGIGWMISLKNNTSAEDNGAFNVGIGIHTTSINVLGGGVRADEPLPPGVTEVGLKRTDDFGVMIMFSFTFFAP